MGRKSPQEVVANVAGRIYRQAERDGKGITMREAQSQALAVAERSAAEKRDGKPRSVAAPPSLPEGFVEKGKD